MRAEAEQRSGDLRRGRYPVLATVADVLPNAMFRLRMEDGSERLAHVAGVLRLGSPRLLPGDMVEVEVSPLDPTKVRITSRALRRGR